ncbi:hypothetical protein ADUPG1_003907, partial [Aduncisulcus paluster]
RIGVSDEWDELIPIAQYAINTSVHRVTGKSPYEALFGSIYAPSRGMLVDWDQNLHRRREEEDEEESSQSPPELMNEYVKVLKERIDFVQDVMRMRQEEVLDARRKRELDRLTKAMGPRARTYDLDGIEIP